MIAIVWFCAILLVRGVAQSRAAGSMQMKFVWVNEGSRPGTTSSMDHMVITKNKAGIKGGIQRFAASITIPVEMMKSARFVISDRVMVGFCIDADRGRCAALRRVTVGGHKIGPASGPQEKGGSAKTYGKVIRGRVQLAWDDVIQLDFHSSGGCFEVLDDGTLVVWEGAK